MHSQRPRGLEDEGWSEADCDRRLSRVFKRFWELSMGSGSGAELNNTQYCAVHKLIFKALTPWFNERAEVTPSLIFKGHPNLTRFREQFRLLYTPSLRPTPGAVTLTLSRPTLTHSSDPSPQASP